MDEYFRWREVLREQIEKELDYQVGMRLAGGTRMVVRSSSSAHKVEHERLPFSRRRIEPKQRDRIFNAPTGSTLESVPVSRQLIESPTTQCINHDQSKVYQSPRARIMNEGRKDQGSELDQVARTAPRIFSPIEGTQNLNPVTIACENLGSKLSMLFSYVNSKYGTPVDQLQHLSSSGCFKSGSIESSGDGSGSVIFFPPEANITLPTPTHSVNTSPTLFPLKLGSIESNLISSVISPAGRCNLGNSHGQLKEEAPMPNLQLQFESRFEGGNLQQAIEIGPQEYKLILRPDFYSKRHMQWFYFKVYGMHANIPYHFHIVNLQKPDSLYNHGMQPLLYSEKDTERGWTRVGYNIAYSKNCSPSSVMSCDKDLFTLSWTMEFPHSDDHCFLAHCFPYPFSKLLGFIKNLQLSPTVAPHVQCQELCKTLAGNACPLLTITNFQDMSNMSSRGGVLVTARVHPGESNSSWMIQGLINWLTSDTPHAKVLRSHFVFKLIPMLNPDGVIVGNSRTSLAGVDLNRTYKKPKRDLFPTVFHTKALLGSFIQEREVVLYIDLHGHSRKQNVFTYGCGSTKGDHYQFLNERVFPFLLSRQLPSMFCFKSCKYSVQRCKESTGRVVAWRMGLDNAFTLESTFCGSTLGQTLRWQFCERDLEGIGCGLGEAIYRYHRMLTSKRYKQKVLSELAEVLLRKCDSSARDVELPDIVQSAVHQQRPTTGNRRDINEPTEKITTTRRTSHSPNKMLREFMKCDLSRLEVESSTTGSDSENDEIEYLGTKKSKQQRRRRRHRSIQRSTTLPSLQPPPANWHTPAPRDSSSQMYEPGNQIKSVASIHGPTRSGQVRSKCSDIGKRVPQEQQASGNEQTWRFVNRYAHRSNGGIPIFSEERLKERARKHQLQTSSETPTDQSPRTHLLWQPEDSSVQMGMATEETWRGGSGQGCVSSSGTSQQGYMTISRLEKPPEIACRKMNTSITGKRVAAPMLTGQMDRIRLKLLGEMQQLERTKKHQGSGCGFTNTTALKLPTHLAKYISEIWKSSIQ